MQAAHTTPVYVTVDGGEFHDPAARGHLLTQSEHHLTQSEHPLAELEAVLHHRHDDVDHQAWRYREGLMERIEATRRVIGRMRERD
jgi:hypothetical protein